ncbi:hypothetical protein SARC_07121 [Sphaeroforma arctica JP610]|uniref:Globin family profile domain-containing protein n=1 Tax=Sphaeroforma arctica JP610 TaxID=667725 RepID=A0A0L0FUI4_9EUKA|nr:hypothetical protein SARC_07121 [Sphaeroforma arctica JP610]KNC80515.1 hypothetical protein SARC_07121 [Sphaeroforma arctica JP610]|eukprot:XP_014154417.1 hypothetical protein SARC_07121 [Sphaeroforma arctica JP610]
MTMSTLKSTTRMQTPSRHRSQLRGSELEHVLSSSNIALDFKPCVRDSWALVRGMKLPEGTYPMSKFLSVYFDNLFLHIPETQELFPDLPLQSEYIALLLSVVVNYDESPTNEIDKKKQKYKKLVKDLDFSMHTHILAGRALLRTLQICLEEDDFKTDVREAWAAEYANLAHFACKQSERSEVTKEAIANLVVYLDITNQKFLDMLNDGDEYKLMVPRSAIKADRLGSLRRALGTKSRSDSELTRRGSKELTQALTINSSTVKPVASNTLHVNNSKALRRASGTSVLTSQPSKGNKLRRASGPEQLITGEVN